MMNKTEKVFLIILALTTIVSGIIAISKERRYADTLNRKTDAQNNPLGAAYGHNSSLSCMPRVYFYSYDIDGIVIFYFLLLMTAVFFYGITAINLWYTWVKNKQVWRVFYIMGLIFILPYYLFNILQAGFLILHIFVKTQVCG